MAMYSKGCLAETILEAHRFDVCRANMMEQEYADIYIRSDTDYVRVGKFLMTAKSHSTGMDADVYIIGGEEPYKIIDGTWWYSPSYNHNYFLWMTGAWDSALEEAQKELQQLVQDVKDKREAERLEEENQQKLKALREKEAIEALFK